jgi:hypothetical protein
MRGEHAADARYSASRAYVLTYFRDSDATGSPLPRQSPPERLKTHPVHGNASMQNSLLIEVTRGVVGLADGMFMRRHEPSALF